MIRVAFLIDNEHYLGGVNYLRNLLFAIARVGNLSVHPYIFCGKKVSHSFISEFQDLATIVQSNYFDGQSLHWYKYTKLFEYTGLLYSINKLMMSYQIDVVSHSNIYGRSLPYKTLHWIPDFQFLKLPNMYSPRDLYKENKRFKKAICLSDSLVLSSYDAQNDLKSYGHGGVEKSNVLQFIARPDPKIYEMTRQQGLELEKTYNIKTKYFYIANQFWKHKNHMIVFEAINLLKRRGFNILLVCSGHLKDFRRINRAYPEQIQQYIASNNLAENIYLLGVIPYAHVTYFIRNCVSVINPSLFEGWNTAVEEAKSIGKQMILSNIAVHLEQNPPSASYFVPSDLNELAETMLFQWQNSDGGPDLKLEQQARSTLDKRILKFGKTYLDIVQTLKF